MIENRVIVAGAGPVGMTAAACLVRQGIPVTVLEAGAALSRESRASTFHPSTLDMLLPLGATEGLLEAGLRAPYLQYRSKEEGLLARCDFGEIADMTAHPYRLQCEQWHLTRVMLAQLEGNPDFEILFDHAVEDCEQDDDGVTVTIRSGRRTSRRGARWLIGTDGAGSNVRNALGLQFEGFTWPDRFLVLSTPFDYAEHIPGLDSVSYVADPEQWHFLLRIPRLWRVMVPIAPDVEDEQALAPDYGRRCLDWVLAGSGSAEIEHRTLYRVHQRVAKSFRKGRVFLAGDAAHINNPLGGMGMNGGIHDAVNLAGLLTEAWHTRGRAPDLDRYDRQRRTVTMHAVQTQTIQNKKDLEASTPADRAAFRTRLQAALDSEQERRAYLRRLAMFTSLEQAAAVA